MSGKRETVCVVLANGCGLPFCDIEHLSAWAHAIGRRTEVAVSSTDERTPYCSHCHWCGNRIRRPDTCLLHDDGQNCPERNWLYTRQATETISTWCSTTGHPPDDHDLHDLEITASRHPNWSRHDIVNHILEQRT